MAVTQKMSRCPRWLCVYGHFALLVPTALILVVSCGKDSSAARRPAAMQGRWRGVSADGKQLLSFGMWGDGRYEWRQANAADRSPILGHDGTWQAADADAAEGTVDAVDLFCRELHSETVQRIETDTRYRIDFNVLTNEGERIQIRSPWGTFVCQHDQGA